MNQSLRAERRTQMETQPEQSLYEAIGGEQMIHRLVESFYPKVYQDPDLSPLFQDDMEHVKQKQFQFLTQFTGGPSLYSDQYGHPKLRFRHMSFEITPQRAKAWLRCMHQAMDEVGLSGYPRQWFYERLTQVANFMINTGDKGERS
jgi:hemoglobin